MLADYQQAIVDFTEAINIKSSFADYYFNRALFEFYLEQDEEACEDLSHAAKLGDEEAQECLKELCVLSLGDN